MTRHGWQVNYILRSIFFNHNVAIQLSLFWFVPLHLREVVIVMLILMKALRDKQPLYPYSYSLQLQKTNIHDICSLNAYIYRYGYWEKKQSVNKDWEQTKHSKKEIKLTSNTSTNPIKRQIWIQGNILGRSMLKKIHNSKNNRHFSFKPWSFKPKANYHWVLWFTKNFAFLTYGTKFMKNVMQDAWLMECEILQVKGSHNTILRPWHADIWMTTLVIFNCITEHMIIQQNALNKC